MAGKPGLPRPESAVAGCCWTGAGTGGWEGDRETPLCLRSWVEKSNCTSEPGVWWEGMRQEQQAGGGDPPQSPASFSSKVSPLVAFSAVLEAYIHGKEREKMCQFPTT